MQLVVADTTVLFPGLIDPDSLYRKLLVVFAWGKLQADLRAADEEQAEIATLLDKHEGAELGGAWQPDEVLIQARERVALLEEHLPPETPTDFGLVVSTAISQEVYEVATGERSPLGGRSEELALAAVASGVAISSAYVVDGFDDDIPQYTEGRDRRDDHVVHSAALSGADWVLSQDRRHIALDHRRPTVYRDPDGERQYRAVGLRYFLNEVLCTGLHFGIDDFKAVDGALLGAALQAIEQPAAP